MWLHPPAGVILGITLAAAVAAAPDLAAAQQWGEELNLSAAPLADSANPRATCTGASSDPETCVTSFSVKDPDPKTLTLRPRRGPRGHRGPQGCHANEIEVQTPAVDPGTQCICPAGATCHTVTVHH